jgi:hypothetical protein
MKEKIDSDRKQVHPDTDKSKLRITASCVRSCLKLFYIH